MKRSILIVAGEVSGDLHSSPVVAAMKRRDPDLHFFGAGGDAMREEGVEILASVRQLAVMGFSGIPKILPKLAELKEDILSRIRRDDVRLAILTDYPGFNLNLAQALKGLANPPRILYYIAPQLWAWRPGRAELIRRYVDRMAVVFRFEVEFFRKWGVEATFVGHPLIDELRPALNVPRTAQTPPLLALLPGSRPSVAKRHLPVLIRSLGAIRRSIPELKVVIGAGASLKEWITREHPRLDIEITADARGLLRQATAAAICSGTATLEAALLGAPQVVFYKTSFLNYAIARRFVTIPHVSLVNVTTGKPIVKELIQYNFTTSSLARELTPLLAGSPPESMIEGYAAVREALGDAGSAERTAALAMEMLS